ncbi:hypothetical protein LPW11_09320 [Geomonas sp. RF6]|uniref:CheR family methyltransferase n=1 Tax=Geomonas sp. RF6 TaxID=2897342 RepID=UPI001E516756|nr:CheR family methyltransferase [Geomonas sp. RF6]UFS72376.1 hypothetical protein LPW11_09320 [Geomonas sp. RF6]
MKGFENYLEYLRHHPAEMAGLADLMHITMTRFFRDGDCWRTLADTWLPALIAEKGKGSVVRAWSAGCCGGEEPYTLAMIWLDKMSSEGGIEITASDIDEASLSRAKEGCYEKGSLREVPPEYLDRFFTKQKTRFCVKKDVTSLVRFERRNIMTDPGPTSIDLVFCRYLVFTYYRGERLRAAAQRLSTALRPGGLLMIGKKEELAEEALEYFCPVPGERFLFRKR